MSDFSLKLDHINLPARDPETLAKWYARSFGLQANGNRVVGPGVLIVFEPGDPVARAPAMHLGFRVPSLAALEHWASTLGAQVKTGSEFASLRTSDPDGNCLEIYCKA